MNRKPIMPAIHGLVDYMFAAALFTVPPLIGCSRKTVWMYHGIAAGTFLYGAITRQPLSLRPVIPMKAHRVIDVVNLSGLSLFTTYKGVRRNKKAIGFNLGMVALGAATVLLTQWRKHDQR